MKISGFIISLIVLLIPFLGLGQDISKKDSTAHKFIPTGVRVGYDLISGGQAIIESGFQALTGGNFRELKLTADIDFYKYLLNVEYGYFQREWIRDGLSTYKNEGYHIKIGPDVNFLHGDPDKSVLFFGFRYAFNKFSDELTYNNQDAFWGDGTNFVQNNDLRADWLELTTGLKVKVYKFIWMGYTARFKFSVDTFEKNVLIPHWIPGYGRAEETSVWGFDYWLMLRLPLPKKE